MIRENTPEGSQTVIHGSSAEFYGFPGLITTLLAYYGYIVNSSQESRKPSYRSRAESQLYLSFIRP